MDEHELAQVTEAMQAFGRAMDGLAAKMIPHFKAIADVVMEAHAAQAAAWFEFDEQLRRQVPLDVDLLRVHDPE